MLTSARRPCVGPGTGTGRKRSSSSIAGLDPTTANVRGESVKTILDEGYVDEATLADPAYRALIARLADRGVRVNRTLSEKQ